MGGVVSASAVLLVLLVAAGIFGYAATTTTPERIELPAFLLPALLVALGAAIFTVFKPKYARYTAPVYALLEGFVVGAISRLYEFQFDGIVRAGRRPHGRRVRHHAVPVLAAGSSGSPTSSAWAS